MNLLAIDYGLKKIGLAKTVGSLAEPLKIIKNQGEEKTISQIGLICQKEQIEKIILGLPDGPLNAKVKAFGQKLFTMTHLPVAFQDETLTSKEAKAKMLEAGIAQSKRKLKEDIFAACLILQDYLEEQEKKM